MKFPSARHAVASPFVKSQGARHAVASPNAVALVFTFALTLGACEREPVDARPEQVVQEFAQRMQRVHGDDPKSARAAYELLWVEARRNLAERAKRASAVAGRKIAPEEMLAPSRFSLKFVPKRYTSTIDGDWALVAVSGGGPDGPTHNVRCVREDGHWRVVLELPPLAPIQHRADGGV
ncbi:MAG TPA: hypothetical protein VFQ35_10165 [Polyangiaceae bacterium]|nr:hypothetical protein [Polyangiaceae bacterium]